MDYPIHGELTDQNEVHEMYKLASNKHLTVRPVYFGSRRWQACLRLVKKGYLVPKKLVKDFDPNNYRKEPETLTLTAKGRDWLLACEPKSFEGQMFWPLPRDVIEWKQAIAEKFGDFT